MPDLAKPPDEATLLAVAQSYLARYGATQASLTRMLDRRVARWANAASGDDVAAKAAAARQAARTVVARLAAAGAVDDAAFAAARARRLTRAGRSRAAAAAHLAARGVSAEAARQALPEDAETELAAAVAFARRRRFGPFRTGAADADRAKRELAAMGRAGFARATATRALTLAADEAVAILARLRAT